MIDKIATAIAIMLGIVIALCGFSLIFHNIYVYFRFNRYIKKNYPDLWKKLVEEGRRIYFPGCPDASEELGDFRINLKENFGNEKLRKIKLICYYTFAIPGWIFVILVFFGLFVSIIIALLNLDKIIW